MTNPTDRELPTLTRLTTRHDPVEDRLRLSGERSDGDTLALWLTQRLLQRLLPALARWLAPEADNDHPTALALQQFAQERAQLARSPAPAVVADHQPAILVTRIDLRPGTDALVLVFMHHDTGIATLTLRHEPLRQWLQILLGQCRAAEWPLTAWPSWLLTATADCARQAPLH